MRPYAIGMIAEERVMRILNIVAAETVLVSLCVADALVFLTLVVPNG